MQSRHGDCATALVGTRIETVGLVVSIPSNALQNPSDFLLDLEQHDAGEEFESPYRADRTRKRDERSITHASVFYNYLSSFCIDHRHR